MFDRSVLDASKLPFHVAIIPDGNGRWAEQQGQNRIFGHIQGTKQVKQIVIAAKEIGIKVLTIYAFSEENWLRPKIEVTTLMQLLKEYLIQERETLLKNCIQLRTIGNIQRIPSDVLEELLKTMALSQQNQAMILNFAISYGGRQEIIETVKKITAACLENRLNVEDLSETLFSNFLSTHDLPDPDLLIRTSGEMRISNFLLWQMAYTELYVTETLWPDFHDEEFIKALLSYQKRERRYGKTSQQIEASRGFFNS